jgi:serine/threonine protein kinase
MSVSKQDIITAIKNSDIFLKIPDLQGAKPRLNPNGSPFAFVGGFNMVFQLEHQNKKWAFRVWHVPMGENKDRYLSISKYLTNLKLPYFADFIYDEKGLLINGELTDTIRMEWLDGILLKDYIEKHLNDKPKLEKLAKDFLEMSKTLRDNKISHGDLQEGNLLVDSSGKIRLVDYDSICIPNIEGQSELVTGLKGYQHPSRFKNSKASLKADYFSELIIYLSILGIASKPELWDKYQVKNSCYLLFTETDFEKIESSQIHCDLKGSNLLIDKLLIVLKKYTDESNYLNLRSFEDYFIPPKILYFKSDRETIISGVEVTLNWKVEGADDIEISEGLGKVKESDSITVKPISGRNYKIIATNKFGVDEQQVNISTFPTPVIETLKIPMPDFTSRVNLNPIQISLPKIDVSINFDSLISQRPIFTKQSNEVSALQPQHKPINQLNLSSIYENIRRKISR